MNDLTKGIAGVLLAILGFWMSWVSLTLVSIKEDVAVQKALNKGAIEVYTDIYSRLTK